MIRESHMKSANENNKMRSWPAGLAYDPRTRVQIHSRMRDGPIGTPRVLQQLITKPIGTIKSQHLETRTLYFNKNCTEVGILS